MSKLVLSLPDDDLVHLRSYASFVEKTSVSGAVQNWVYRYAWPTIWKNERVQQVIDVEPEILRAVNKITVAYNLAHGYANNRIGRFPVHDVANALKSSDTYNALLRRGINDMIAKGERDP